MKKIYFLFLSCIIAINFLSASETKTLLSLENIPTEIFEYYFFPHLNLKNLENLSETSLYFFSITENEKIKKYLKSLYYINPGIDSQNQLGWKQACNTLWHLDNFCTPAYLQLNQNEYIQNFIQIHTDINSNTILSIDTEKVKEKFSKDLLSIASKFLSLNKSLIIIENHANAYNETENFDTFFYIKDLTLNHNNINKIITFCNSYKFFDENGNTPLHIASHNENIVNAGVNINIRNKYGDIPLHIASYRGYTSIVQKLINAGADVNIQNNDGKTPLFIASNQGKIPTVQQLINVGADTNIQTKHGETPLYIAAYNGNTAIVKILINAGANLNTLDNLGETPLYIASRFNNVDIVEMLIKAGADINTRNEYDGQTPLYSAVYNDKIEAVKILIKYGAGINIPNIYGETPLDIAYENENTKMVEILLNAGAKKSNNK